MKHNIPRDLIDQYGFTLIELMISLVLGLLISAAVMQVFLTSQRVDRIQKAGSEIQDKAVFGIQSIEDHVRLANLGNDGVPTNDTTARGGIVLTAGNSEDSGGGTNDKEKEDKEDEDKEKEKEADQCDITTALDSKDKDQRSRNLDASKDCIDKVIKDLAIDGLKDEFDRLEASLENGLNDREKTNLGHEIDKLKNELGDLKSEAEGLKSELGDLKGDLKPDSKDKLNEINKKLNDIAKRVNDIAKNKDIIRQKYEKNTGAKKVSYLKNEYYSAPQPAVFFQRAYFKKANFQKISLGKPSLFNVVVKGGLASGYLTRSGSMSSTGRVNKWNGSLSNTNTPSDQLTIQYINTTGRVIYDCEGSEIKPDERAIMRYFVVEDKVKTNKARKNLNLNCEAGRIKKVDDEFNIVGFGGSRTGQTIIQNIDQFNIRLGIQRTVINDGNLSYEYADMTVEEYMSLPGDKPYITNIRIAILARSTSNSPETSSNRFLIYNEEQELKDQDNAPKYLRRVYQTNILLRNARLMPIVDNITT